MESLQFQKAEYSDPRRKCVLCSGVIEKSYFQLAGQTVCPTCAQQANAGQSRPSHSLVLRALLYGVGAALVCSICYAVITYATGLELAIAAIAVGYLVGRAVRIGSNGLGGRRCQIIAVVLTYLSITTSYIPLLIKGTREPAHDSDTATPSVGNQDTPQNPEAQLKGSLNQASFPSGLVLGALLGVALISPFLGLTEGVGGLLGLAIIIFGLLQAWKQTARKGYVLSGPYTLNESPSAG